MCNKKRLFRTMCFLYAKKFPLTLLCAAAIWVLCLIPVPETRLADVPFIDKWAHMVMYGGLTFLFWTELRFSRLRPPLSRCAVWGVAVPVLMSGLLELLQTYATTCRSGDWADFAANAVGVALGTVYGAFLMRRR